MTQSATVKRLHPEKDEDAFFRERFIGILGHDLRNPLQSITMSAELLMSAGQLDDLQRRSVLRISNAADRMARMINDLLDFTRGRMGGEFPITRVRCDVHAVCRQVIEELTAGHPERKLSFESSGDGWGNFDPDRLAQLVSNLAANALKHGDPNRPVKVTVQDHGSELSIAVHNEGKPIPEDQVSRLFDPFVQLPGDGRRPASDGLGLGLYITQLIVQAHGGSVSVRSTAEEGTTFLVRLPK